MPELPVYGFAPDLGGLLGLLITVGLPILVGLVTTRSTSPAAKAVLLLLLTALKSVLEAWLQAENTAVALDPVPVIYTTAINFVIAVAVHFGLYRPTGATAAAQDTLVKDRPAS
jgi:hypothetical protein